MRILMIDIDTLRPDHMSCYGYRRRTTPNLDLIAADGMRFDQYYCVDAPCLPSRASLLTGQFGFHHGAVGHGGTAADRRLAGCPRDFRNALDENNLIHLFRKAGMHTVSISTFAERHSAWWFNSGFKEMYNVGKGGNESGEEVVPIALDWIGRHAADDNWFMHLHLWDPHTPYRAPADLGDPFADEPLPEWIDDEAFQKHLQHTGPHSLNEVGMFDDHENPAYPRHPGRVTDRAGLRRLFDGYDCGIRHADNLLGTVFAALKEQGVYDDLAIIITSDHGENMGELGIYSEHATADEPTCHIPLIIRWPGARRGINHGLYGNIDLCPTLADLLGVPHFDQWDGISFANTLIPEIPNPGERKGGGRDFLVLSQQAHVCQRSVRFDDWLYVRTLHDGYHLFPREMLFNLADDPHETHDLAEDLPELCCKAARLLLGWQEDMMLSAPGISDPMWTVMQEGGPYHARGHLDAYLLRLDATGRKAGADALRRKYKKQGPA